MNNVMVDCETLGVGPFPTLLSIGAVFFDPEANTVPQPPPGEPNPTGMGGMPWTRECFFYQIDPESCVKLGASVETNTLRWWFQNSDSVDARRYILGSIIAPVEEVLGRFCRWVRAVQTEGDCVLWSHGLMADARWLEGYVAKMPGLVWPFGYRNHRDTRTVFRLAELKRGEDLDCPQAAIPHHPLHDAIAQALRVQLAYRALGI